MNLVMLMAILSFICYRLNRKLVGLILAIFGFTFFMLFSTKYLPGYLIMKIESKYASFEASKYPFGSERVYIHCLGGGYTVDKRLPPQAQLSNVGLGRLSEAIRIFHLYDSSTLVFSGNIASGEESLASVAKKAAIGLGIGEDRIEILEEPSTTLEEAKAFAKRFGSTVPVIVVTDAIHMPRAIKFFQAQGIHPFPAPTNYYTKDDDNPFALRWMPSVENFLLMDRALREFLGSVKAAL